MFNNRQNIIISRSIDRSIDCVYGLYKRGYGKKKLFGTFFFISWFEFLLWIVNFWECGYGKKKLFGTFFLFPDLNCYFELLTFENVAMVKLWPLFLNSSPGDLEQKAKRWELHRPYKGMTITILHSITVIQLNDLHLCTSRSALITLCIDLKNITMKYYTEIFL